MTLDPLPCGALHRLPGAVTYLAPAALQVQAGCPLRVLRRMPPRPPQCSLRGDLPGWGHGLLCRRDGEGMPMGHWEANPNKHLIFIQDSVTLKSR